MPPMPTKWMGPISRGSFIAGVLVFCRRRIIAGVHTRHPQHQIGQPLGGVDRAGRFGGGRHCGEAAGLGGQRRDLGGQPFRREIGLVEADRAARLLQHAGIGELVLVERMRQRHQDGGPADRRKLGHGRGARARDHEMARRHPRRQIGEERRHLGGDLEPVIDLAHARQVLLARLLHDREPRVQMRLEPFDRGRHDVGHDARALAAAEHQKLQRPAGNERRIGVAAAAITAGRTGLPVCVALAASAGSASSTPAKLVAIALTRGASSRLARPITAFCSWIRVGMPRSVAASTGGTVG